MRHHFDLPEGDREFLDGRGRPWETIVSGQRWLLVGDYEVCPGYNHSQVLVALAIEPAYPDSQIDMAYVFPALSLASGRAIGALADHPIDGKTFQRWSRHRTPQNPWRVGIDSVATHLIQVDQWLRREVA
jgi:hypothetical protein